MVRSSGTRSKIQAESLADVESCRETGFGCRYGSVHPFLGAAHRGVLGWTNPPSERWWLDHWKKRGAKPIDESCSGSILTRPSAIFGSVLVQETYLCAYLRERKIRFFDKRKKTHHHRLFYVCRRISASASTQDNQYTFPFSKPLPIRYHFAVLK